jgi:hypothetical protein
MVGAAVGGSDHPVGQGTGTTAELAARDSNKHVTGSDVFKAYAPYLIIIALFSITQIPVSRDAFAAPRSLSHGRVWICRARRASLRPCRPSSSTGSPGRAPSW